MNIKKKETCWLILLICLIVILLLILLWPSSSSDDAESSDILSALDSAVDSELSLPAESTDSEAEISSEPDSEAASEPEQNESSEPEQSESSKADEESKATTTTSGSSSGSTTFPNTNSTVIDLSATEWNLILVNRKHSLPEDFTVTTKSINDSHRVDERIYDALTQMLADARAEGLSPVVCSSFRTWEGQTRLFNNEFYDWLAQGYSEAEAYNLTSQLTAIPGTSEHQTGLAVDIVSNYNWNLDESQEKTEEQQWLMAHCYEYGFILRFPNNKTEYTGIVYEPWHYRYVGVELATYLTKNGLCLEEYLDPGTTIDPYTGE